MRLSPGAVPHNSDCLASANWFCEYLRPGWAMFSFVYISWEWVCQGNHPSNRFPPSVLAGVISRCIWELTAQGFGWDRNPATGGAGAASQHDQHTTFIYRWRTVFPNFWSRSFVNWLPFCKKALCYNTAKRKEPEPHYETQTPFFVELILACNSKLASEFLYCRRGDRA